jgi:hypothetical protein
VETVQKSMRRVLGNLMTQVVFWGLPDSRKQLLHPDADGLFKPIITHIVKFPMKEVAYLEFGVQLAMWHSYLHRYHIDPQTAPGGSCLACSTGCLWMHRMERIHIRSVNIDLHHIGVFGSGHWHISESSSRCLETDLSEGRRTNCSRIPYAPALLPSQYHWFFCWSNLGLL